MREYNATVGATDGNIIAAIITTHTPRNQANPPSPVHGPASMPRIACAVHAHPAPARTKSVSTRPSRVRTAASAGPGPPRAAPFAGAATSPVTMLTTSGDPRELGLRQPGLAFVGDPEGADPAALRLRHGQVGPDWMEHAVEADRLAGLDAERHDVLDLEVDRVADAHAVAQAVVGHLDRRALHAEDLADQGRKCTHRSAELAAEDLDELLELLVVRAIVDEHAEPPVALGHHFRRVRDQRSPQSADVGAVDRPGPDVEHQRDPAEVVGGAVVERQVARAHQLARARLDVASGQVPCHDESPPQKAPSLRPVRCSVNDPD